jgi:hypothetical protein
LRPTNIPRHALIVKHIGADYHQNNTNDYRSLGKVSFQKMFGTA